MKKCGPPNRSGVNWKSGDETEKARMRLYQRRYKEKAGERYKRIQKTSGLKKYGITLEQYEQLFELQNGVCAICEQPQINGKLLSVDHCHTTGKIRGLLCVKCNSGIGFFNEDAEIVKKVVGYLS